MKKHFLMSIAGFTLAEVLITLTVIGVIAALTIPSLIQDIQDAQYKTQWKKIYSDINQATMKMVSDNGGSIKSICNNGSGDLDSNCLRDNYLKYLNYDKKCDYSVGLGNCWHNNNAAYAYDGSLVTGLSPRSGAFLTNGAMLGFGGWYAPNCSTNIGSPVVFQRCGWISIDVNGFNAPNTYGRDIFMVHVLENTIKPYGVYGDGMENTCNHSSGNNGNGCAAKFLYQ